MNVLPEGEAAFNKLFYTYKKNAEFRGIAFYLSKKTFRKLTKQNCTYCGVQPQQIAYQYNRAGRASTPYYYNGVDRIDNECGYYADNVNSCCWICNNAKRSLSLQQFREWLSRVSNFNCEGARRIGRKEST